MIELTYIKKSSIDNKKVVSLSLFKIYGGGYRDFTKYVDNLILSISFIKKNLTDYNINLYIDSGVLNDNDFKKILDDKSYDNLNVILYNCELFKINDLYHDGIFGTFVRFLPLFDNEYDIVYVRDVDLPETFFTKSYEELLNKHNASVFVNSFLFYDKPWSDINFPILAGLFVSKAKFDIKILYNFLNDIKEGNYNDIIQNIKSYHKQLDSRQTQATYLPFGMDEYFLNHILRKEFKNNKLKIIVNLFMDIGKFIKHVYFNDHLFNKKDANNLYSLERETWDGNMESFKKMMRMSQYHMKIIKEKLYHKYKKVIDRYNEYSKLVIYSIIGVNAYKIYDFS